jgi:glucose dehydrogenase
VRWRTEVPAPVADVSLTAGFVAIDERRVVLASADRALVAWDAANGKVVS